MQEPEACLGHCQTFVIELLCKNVNGQKLLTIFAKKLRHRYCNWQGPQYDSDGIFPLSIYLGDHFEFRISRFRNFTGIHKGIYDLIKPLGWSFLEEIWTNLSKLFPEFSKLFVRPNWEFAHWSLRRYLIQIWNCTLKGFMIALLSIMQTLCYL